MTMSETGNDSVDLGEAAVSWSRQRTTPRWLMTPSA